MASGSPPFRRGVRRLQFREFFDQVARPTVDVVFAHGRSHPFHAGLLFGGVHLEGEPDGLGQLFGVIGIHDQRIPQLAGSPREPAQDQDPTLVVPRRHEFLGHQVHPVVEGCHHAHVGRFVERQDLPVAVVFLQKDDGPVVLGLELPVDPFGLLLDLRQKVMVALDVGAAGSPDLDEDEFPLIPGVFLQETFNPAEPFQDALGVIHPFHADAEIFRLDPQLFQQGRTVFQGRLGFDAGILKGVGKRHADGEGFHQGRVSLFVDAEPFPINPGFEGPVHSVEEIVAVELGVEPDEVCSEHAVKEVLLPGTDAEGFGIRPGDVPERGDACVGPFLFQEAGQEREMIILDQHTGFLDPP